MFYGLRRPGSQSSSSSRPNRPPRATPSRPHPPPRGHGTVTVIRRATTTLTPPSSSSSLGWACLSPSSPLGRAPCCRRCRGTDEPPRRLRSPKPPRRRAGSSAFGRAPHSSRGRCRRGCAGAGRSVWEEYGREKGHGLWRESWLVLVSTGFAEALAAAWGKSLAGQAGHAAALRQCCG